MTRNRSTEKDSPIRATSPPSGAKPVVAQERSSGAQTGLGRYGVPLSPGGVARLQTEAGNRAVVQMLRGGRATRSDPETVVQRAPGDGAPADGAVGTTPRTGTRAPVPDAAPQLAAAA